MKRNLLLISVILGCSCNASKEANRTTTYQPPLAYKQWTLEKIPNFELEDLTRLPVIEFNDSAKRVSGFSGCNGFGGNYKVSRNKQLNFVDIISTQMACHPGSTTETKVFSAIDVVDNYEIKGNFLYLKQGNDTLLIYKKSDVK